MLIMGHRGAAGIKPEGTVASLRAAMDIGVDIIEIDIRLTKDRIPVLWHDPRMKQRWLPRSERLSSLTLTELRKRTAGTDRPITTLETALKECFGKVLLNLELKQAHSFEHSWPVLRKYINKKNDWQYFIFSSFSPAELRRVRKASPHAQLSLLHRANSFLFLRHMRGLKLSAVGFHRLHVNRLSLGVAKKLGLFTYAYTVNRPAGARQLASRGIDAVCTDRPDLLVKAGSNPNSSKDALPQD